MAQFLLFCLASVGTTAILVHGAIFESFRENLASHVEHIRQRRERLKVKPTFTLSEFVHSIVSCYQCCGFWCGLFCGLFLITGTDAFFADPRRPFILLHSVFMLFCCGAAGSILAHVYMIFVELIFSITMYFKSLLPEHDHDHDESE